MGERLRGVVPQPLRDELLDREEFVSVLEARVVSREWKEEYNEIRPHSALGYQTPAAFASSCGRTSSAEPAPARPQLDGDQNG